MTSATAVDTLRRGFSALRWYVGSVMGDRDYDRYLAHHGASHPDRPPMSEREYWRARFDEQERNPQGRCC